VLSKVSTSSGLVCGAILLLALLAGCRSDPSIDLLESELRFLEDKVYALQDVVQQKDSQLSSVQRENDALRKRLGLPGDLDDNRRNASPIPERPRQRPAADSFPPKSMDDLESPEIEIGDAADLPDLESVAPIAEVSLTQPASVLESNRVEEAIDRVVTKIVLNPKLTGGYNLDGQPGDEGIMVVIEPQNESAEYVDASGPISIVLLDPAYAGEQAFISRWDFDSTEAAKTLKRSLLGKGFHLKLPWTTDHPDHDTLLLHVRYTTTEGEVLQAKQNIRVDASANKTASWSPAATPLPKRASYEQTEDVNLVELPSSEENNQATTKGAVWRPYR